ncbi:hypothetical protein [Lignipirellula cremea]|uniref:Uncharacterized protein n=1 Tax=Lignipirellula cremea TaxID=2528010 RepID=A0A518E0W6_9BACT|nr:hypothetical protein [Lignipirellula cremea]QDU97738.1 hypothetical protein Pla8534_55920 [Lignipirellula cremea]
MKCLLGAKRLALLTMIGLAPWMSAPALAAAPGPIAAAAADHEEVELFAAMKAGDIEVALIPKDAKVANVLLRNKTDRPLAIKLPEAFAGVPVLAQFGGMGGMGMGGGMGGMGMGGGMNQGFGGGMGGMGMGGMGGMGGGGFGGGGFMNVAPDKVGKLKVPVVCLEHGKDDPNPRVEYQIVPIEEFTGSNEVIEVCKMLGRGEVTQNTAQAAAWHLTDGLSWQELARKDRVKLRNGYTEKYFQPQEIMFAVRIHQEAARRAQANPTVSPGESQNTAQNAAQEIAPQQ